MKTITDIKTELLSNKKISDLVFILWAGGAALLSYSLVYALRKPFTAATFDGLDAFGLDYKVLVTIVQILGYLIAKFVGIKLISELKKEHRMKFILASILVAELSLVLFGLLPAPYNIFAMFFNGLSLGCMWGVIFSFIEGRRTTDILASLLGISIVISSGVAKSIGLFVMNTLHVGEFCSHRRLCPAIACLAGLHPESPAATHPTGHCRKEPACHSQRKTTQRTVPQLHACIDPPVRSQPAVGYPPGY